MMNFKLGMVVVIFILPICLFSQDSLAVENDEQIIEEITPEKSQENSATDQELYGVELSQDDVDKASKDLNFDKTKKAFVLKNLENKEIKEPTSMPSFKGISTVLKFMSFGLVIVLVGFLLYFLLKELRIKKLPKNEKASIALDQITDIANIDFVAMLKEALQNQDFRLALRIQYLQILQALQVKNLIVWRPNKTNRAYTKELIGSNYGNAFGDISKIFEQVWYGHVEINEQTYVRVAGKFENINALVANGK